MRIIDNLFNDKRQVVTFEMFAEEYYSMQKPKWKTNYFEEAKNNLIGLINTKNGTEQNLLQDLVLDFSKIIKATTKEIPDIITKFTTGKYTNIIANDIAFRKEIEDAFNYSSFRKSAKASWFADRFEIKACLYCNAQFTLATGKDGQKKRLLFQLDHFYNKSSFPYLSLSLGNLIPSCSTCNISKSRSPFTINTHIHPYNDDANIKFDFYIDERDALDYLMKDRNYKLLKPKIKIVDPKFNIHQRVFGIEAIYEKHTDIVEELILKSLYYNESKIEELKREFSGLNLSKSVIDRFVLGNYTLDSEINLRPLAKLSKDIGKQLKILK